MHEALASLPEDRLAQSPLAVPASAGTVTVLVGRYRRAGLRRQWSLSPEGFVAVELPNPRQQVGLL